MSLSSDVLDLLADTKEVFIETRSGATISRTIIWVAVHDQTIYVRSVRGESGQWYQRATTDPNVTLIVGEFRIRFRAVAADDPKSIEVASEGFRRKYPKSPSLDAMLHPDVLSTTLRLEPVN